MRADLETLLTQVASGQLQVADAAAQLRGIDPLEYAALDLDRARRRGQPEVILGTGKTPAQIAGIAARLHAAHGRVLATRVTPEAAAEARALADLPWRYVPEARCLMAGDDLPQAGQGPVLVVSAGTADGPVAAEAACCATFLGNRVERLNDVGVAGLQRILACLGQLRAASVVIVVAGLEGALPSVVAGLVARPVIAVPTSVGYGASFGGVTALLGMLSACAAGVTVVNIDNGFGAAFAASLINRPFEPR